jgi:unsaturated rhamnogalacturonyl hydrolase
VRAGVLVLDSRRTGLAILGAAFTLTAGVAVAQQIPSASPVASSGLWSVRMTAALMQRHPVVAEKWDYAAGLALLAVERVADRTHDARYASYVKTNMDRFVQPNGEIRTYRADELSLDQINQGRLLFPLYARTHDPRYRTAVFLLRDQLRHQPRTSDGGFWHKKIYPQQMWLDGLYMAGPFYAEFAKEFGDTAAFRDVAHQLLLVARHTRDSRTGLFYHAWDAAHTQFWADSSTGLSRNFWGRAVGWYLMATVDVLDYMPRNDPDRPALLHTFRELASAVARVQDPVTGLWYQVLDQPSRTGNYLEASGSGMFVYALAKGARLGYLSEEYHAIAERGFDGLTRNLVRVDADGVVSLTGICQVAGLGPSSDRRRDGSFAYYVSEPVVSNDYKGTGPFILAALELNR